MSQLPEHHSVYITKFFGLKINELIERGPALQFSVEYLNHIDFTIL